jgi:hypothetical protein
MVWPYIRCSKVCGGNVEITAIRTSAIYCVYLENNTSTEICPENFTRYTAV